MSALFKYENHLFISYAHIDNYHFSGSAKGWVDLLHERLEIRLAQLLGKKPTIWRDPELKGNDVFNETIVIELSKTAILLSIISPRYLQSSSCRQELENFFRLAAQEVGVRLDVDALHLNAQSGVIGGDSRFARFPNGNHPRKARPAFNV